jgi:hypothetical protein
MRRFAARLTSTPGAADSKRWLSSGGSEEVNRGQRGVRFDSRWSPFAWVSRSLTTFANTGAPGRGLA